MKGNHKHTASVCSNEICSCVYKTHGTHAGQSFFSNFEGTFVSVLNRILQNRPIGGRSKFFHCQHYVERLFFWGERRFLSLPLLFITSNLVKQWLLLLLLFPAVALSVAVVEPVDLIFACICRFWRFLFLPLLSLNWNQMCPTEKEKAKKRKIREFEASKKWAKLKRLVCRLFTFLGLKVGLE